LRFTEFLHFLGRPFNWTFKKIDAGFNLGGVSFEMVEMPRRGGWIG